MTLSSVKSSWARTIAHGSEKPLGVLFVHRNEKEIVNQSKQNPISIFHESEFVLFQMRIINITQDC